MGFFFNKLFKTFYSVVLDNRSCKFYFREVASNKNILSENSQTIIYENNDKIANSFAKFMENTSKEPITSTIICSTNQGAIFPTQNLIEEDDNFIYEIINEKFKVYYSKQESIEINTKFNTNFDQFMSAFKVLYFLFKNQNFSGKALFVLKFEETAAFMVADESGVCYTRIVDIADALTLIAQNPDSDEVEMDDMGEIFYAILQSEIKRFYESANSDFIEQIFIYDNDTLGAEIGYLIYTRLHIKTELIPVDLAEYINKISIKERC